MSYEEIKNKIYEIKKAIDLNIERENDEINKIKKLAQVANNTCQKNNKKRIQIW